MLFFLGTETHLHGSIAVLLFGLDLGDDAGTCLNHRSGNHIAGLVKEAGHTEFFTDKS